MWTIRSRVLRELRLERVWTVDHLEKISGLSLRTLQALEREDRTVRHSTIECLAKVYGVEPSVIARRTAEDAAPAKAKPASSPPPPSPAGITQLPKPTRLEQLVALERTLPALAPLGTRGDRVPPLDAKRYQDVFTAYATHEGELAYVTGRVDLQRGISKDEAGLLGTRSGVGARFHFVRTIAVGHEIGMTVHTARAEDTKALQDAFGRVATAIVRVVLAPEEALAQGGGFTFFMSERPRPWALRVEQVIRVPPPTARRSRASAP